MESVKRAAPSNTACDGSCSESEDSQRVSRTRQTLKSPQPGQVHPRPPPTPTTRPSKKKRVLRVASPCVSRMVCSEAEVSGDESDDEEEDEDDEEGDGHRLDDEPDEELDDSRDMYRALDNAREDEVDGGGELSQPFSQMHVDAGYVAPETAAWMSFDRATDLLGAGEGNNLALRPVDCFGSRIASFQYRNISTGSDYKSKWSPLLSIEALAKAQGMTLSAFAEEALLVSLMQEKKEYGSRYAVIEGPRDQAYNILVQSLTATVPREPDFRSVAECIYLSGEVRVYADVEFYRPLEDREKAAVDAVDLVKKFCQYMSKVLPDEHKLPTTGYKTFAELASHEKASRLSICRASREDMMEDASKKKVPAWKESMHIMLSDVFFKDMTTLKIAMKHVGEHLMSEGFTKTPYTKGEGVIDPSVYGAMKNLRIAGETKWGQDPESRLVPVTNVNDLRLHIVGALPYPDDRVVLEHKDLSGSNKWKGYAQHAVQGQKEASLQAAVGSVALMGFEGSLKMFAQQLLEGRVQAEPGDFQVRILDSKKHIYLNYREQTCLVDPSARHVGQPWHSAMDIDLTTPDIRIFFNCWGQHKERPELLWQHFERVRAKQQSTYGCVVPEASPYVGIRRCVFLQFATAVPELRLPDHLSDVISVLTKCQGQWYFMRTLPHDRVIGGILLCSTRQGEWWEIGAQQVTWCSCPTEARDDEARRVMYCAESKNPSERQQYIQTWVPLRPLLFPDMYTPTVISENFNEKEYMTRWVNMRFSCSVGGFAKRMDGKDFTFFQVGRVPYRLEKMPYTDSANLLDEVVKKEGGIVRHMWAGFNDNTRKPLYQLLERFKSNIPDIGTKPDPSITYGDTGRFRLPDRFITDKAEFKALFQPVYDLDGVTPFLPRTHTESAWNEAYCDGMEYAPSWKAVVEFQLEPDEAKWFYAMFGRCYLYCHLNGLGFDDSWRLMVHIWGVSSTGKSKVLIALQRILGSLAAILGTGARTRNQTACTQFLIDKEGAFCTEASQDKDGAPWQLIERDLFKLWSHGDGIPAAIMYSGGQGLIKPTPMMMFAANQRYLAVEFGAKSWDDFNGLANGIARFHFKREVPLSDHDTDLEAHLIDELPRCLPYMMWCYMEKVLEVGSQPVLRVPYFQRSYREAILVHHPWGKFARHRVVVEDGASFQIMELKSALNAFYGDKLYTFMGSSSTNSKEKWALQMDQKAATSNNLSLSSEYKVFLELAGLQAQMRPEKITHLKEKRECEWANVLSTAKLSPCSAFFVKSDTSSVEALYNQAQKRGNICLQSAIEKVMEIDKKIAQLRGEAPQVVYSHQGRESETVWSCVTCHVRGKMRLFDASNVCQEGHSYSKANRRQAARCIVNMRLLGADENIYAPYGDHTDG